MPIIKKEFVDNSIFRELNEKYPPLDANNGVSYKQKLDYLTFETDFLTDPRLRVLIRQYGYGVLAIIFYLRTAMCNNGWKIRADNEYYQCLLSDCGYACGFNMDYTHEVIQKLLEKRLMFNVCDESVEEGVWITCPQQIYNYEMACNNRMQSRSRQARYREKVKKQREQNISADDFFNNEIIEDPFAIDS